MYNVIINAHAQRDLRKLPKDIQLRLAPKLRSLSEHPHLEQLKKLKGSKNAWRLRVGDYRILYETHASARKLTIYSIEPRKDAY